MKTSTLFTNYIHSSFGRFLLCVPTVIGCFAISPMARAVVPPPDGGYPNNNTAEGDSALFNLTNGLDNTAIGLQALFLNTEGDFNTASGADALAGNHGSFNTANGYQALLFNTGGGYNTATGTAALRSNVSGFQNLANGVNALYSNATGYRNTANGYQALYFNTTGNRNTAEGFQALFHNIGSDNVGLGFNAGSNLTIGNGNVCIGNGVLGVAGESNTTRIKNVYSSVASGRAVYVSSDNKMGTLVSSRRFKDQIQPMDKASESILALKPVTFLYKKEIEPNGSVMFGLIAEEVEQVDPDLVTLNDKGEVEAVRYEAVNAMLLNEFLKEHRTVQELQSAAAKQEATIERQQKQIDALTEGLHKVSAQLEASKPAPQVANNP